MQRLAEKILQDRGLDKSELSILLINDKRIKALNRQYRGLNQPTDILAFPMQEGEFKGLNPEILGDLALSLDTALRQAKDAGHQIERELAMLIIHGILHLLGFDHEKGGREEKKMKREEAQIMKDIEFLIPVRADLV